MTFSYILIIHLFHFIFSRIIIPFEKENKEINSLKDIMNDVFKCKIELGNPSQFLYLSLNFYYHGFLITSKSLNNFSFDELKSTSISIESSYKSEHIDNKLNTYSLNSMDEFKLLTEEGTKTNNNIYFNLVKNSTDNKTLSSGLIGLKIISMLIYKEENFIYQLKQLNSIKNLVFFLNFNDEKNKGLFLGNYPDEYDKNFDEKDFYYTKALSDEMSVVWELFFDEVKYGKNKYNNKYFKFNLLINGIIGPNNYKEYLKNNYFNIFLSNNDCKEENFPNFNSNYSGFYCNDNINLKDNFETLYLYHKELNYTFELKYEDLFKLHNNKIYFLIFFNEKNEDWTLGEIFLKKYLFIFDMDRKTLGIYNKNNYLNRKINNNNINNLLIFKIFICILILCILVLLFLIRKYKLKKKLRKNQMIDDNYLYKSKNENNYNILN